MKKKFPRQRFKYTPLSKMQRDDEQFPSFLYEVRRTAAFHYYFQSNKLQALIRLLLALRLFVVADRLLILLCMRA